MICALAPLFLLLSTLRSANDGSGDGLAEADSARIDTLVEEFRGRYEIPALQIAFAKEGKLVFARGYGRADAAGEVPVTPAHLFRIASVSKPITSVAVLRLVERGELLLDQRVFGEGAILGTRFGTPPYSERVLAITLEQLLTHTAGGWDNQRDDPMFQRPDLVHAELIGWVLDTNALEQEPGTHYAYSNFGYCVLGRVIEAVCGKPYEDAVRELVLEPAGCQDLQIAADTLEGRRENEVEYFQPGADPYGMRVTRMDSHGGWLASAPDLLRFAVRVDGFDSVPDLLQPDTLRVMTTASTANPRYAKGWSVNPEGNWWHTGSLPGTATILVRTHHGFCWAVLANRRAGGDFSRDLDQLPWRIVESVEHWPQGETL